MHPRLKGVRNQGLRNSSFHLRETLMVVKFTFVDYLKNTQLILYTVRCKSTRLAPPLDWNLGSPIMKIAPLLRGKEVNNLQDLELSVLSDDGEYGDRFKPGRGAVSGGAYGRNLRCG